MNQGKNNFGFLWPEYTRPSTENPNMGFDDLKKKEEKKSSWQFSFFKFSWPKTTYFLSNKETMPNSEKEICLT